MYILGNVRGNNFGRDRGIAPASSRAGALRYIVSRIHTLQTKMGSDNPKNLGNKLGRLVETPNLFNWVYLTQFMYPKLPTTTQKNESEITHYRDPTVSLGNLRSTLTLFLRLIRLYWIVPYAHFLPQKIHMYYFLIHI